MIEFERTMVTHTTFKGEFYPMKEAKKRLLYFLSLNQLRSVDKIRLLTIFIYSYCILYILLCILIIDETVDDNDIQQLKENITHNLIPNLDSFLDKFIEISSFFHYSSEQILHLHHIIRERLNTTENPGSAVEIVRIIYNLFEK